MNKYLFAALLVLISSRAYAVKFPVKTFSADGTQVVAIIPKSNGMWRATVKTNGDYGGGTMTFAHSASSSCSPSNIEKDSTGVSYSSTDDDMFTVEHGIDRDNNTYLCATLSGATSPSITVTVSDNR